MSFGIGPALLLPCYHYTAGFSVRQAGEKQSQGRFSVADGKERGHRSTEAGQSSSKGVTLPMASGQRSSFLGVFGGIADPGKARGKRRPGSLMLLRIALGILPGEQTPSRLPWPSFPLCSSPFCGSQGGEDPECVQTLLEDLRPGKVVMRLSEDLA